jgi:hypothetical protein
MSDVNMNNKMKHVLVVDTIPVKQRNSSKTDRRSWKECGPDMSRMQVLVERDSTSPHRVHKNENHIHSFDDDGLKCTCVKYKASEWPRMQTDKHSEK